MLPEKWAPRLLDNSIWKDFDSMFDNFLPTQRGPAHRVTNWVPSLDLYDDGDSYKVKVDLPGLSIEDIDIQLNESILAIKGERKQELISEENGYRRVERGYGSFMRTVNLPRNIEEDEVSAKFVDGVLTITVPKNEEVEPVGRKIEIELE